MKEINDVQDEGVIRLCIAIIRLAVKDYKQAYRLIRKLQSPDWNVKFRKRYSKYLDGIEPEKQQEYLELMRDRQLIGAERTISEVENLFHSRLYYSISNIDGDVFLERIRKEIQNEV